MNKATLWLKQLCLTGPEKDNAHLSFHSGLNIIYGASDTGKSFIVELIDFMLGGGAPLRDIPERVGYDRIWLTIAASDGEELTLTRSTEGGDLNLYGGTHHAIPTGIKAITLKSKHDPNKDDNISTYLLGKIGLSKKRLLKKKDDGTTNNFTLPFLRHLCIISETDIQKQGSPILSGQYTQATSEMSAFKLLLTGVDDSAIIKSTTSSSVALSRDAKIEVIEELIVTTQSRYNQLSSDLADGDTLTTQIKKLEDAVALEHAEISQTESQYRELSLQRSALRASIEKSIGRKEEIREMLQRFNLLNEHYKSDVERLEGIKEAGSLMSAIASGPCPLCGSEKSIPHPDTPCDGNLEIVFVAANAEKNKVEKLQAELVETIQKLKSEAESFDRIIPKAKQELATLDTSITEVTPSVTEKRTSYQNLIEKLSEVRASASAWNELKELKTKKNSLQIASTEQMMDGAPRAELSSSVLDSFSQVLQTTLQSWNFPNAERVYFDPQKKDFVISGKPRGSRGKGMRAITHSAFTVSLLEYCKRENHPHLGFIVMDSPLLAYREPDVADEGVTESDLNDKFFSYLSKWSDRQAIIIENVDPSARFTDKDYSTYFSGNSNTGRSGFFPTVIRT